MSVVAVAAVVAAVVAAAVDDAMAAPLHPLGPIFEEKCKDK